MATSFADDKDETSVKCVVLNSFGGQDRLEVKHVDFSTKDLKSTQVLVKVEACGLNFADIYTRQGLPTGTTLTLPLICGLECAGLVLKVGKCVQNFQAGDRVLCYTGEYGGMWSELCCVNEAYCHKIPELIPWEVAICLMINYTTAYYSLFHLGNLRKEDAVLIDSAGGGVGWAATQLAKTVQDVVIHGRASCHKHQKIKSNGVDVVIDSQSENFNHPTGGYDLIIDMQSGYKFTELQKSLNPLGRIIHVGGFGMINGDRLSTWSLIKAWWGLKNIRMIDIITGSLSVGGLHLSNLVKSNPNKVKATVKELMGMYLDGKLMPEIYKVYSFEEVKEACTAMENRENIGKIILKPSK